MARRRHKKQHRPEPRKARVKAILEELKKRPDSNMPQLAKALNMRASTHMMNILWDMCENGQLLPTPKKYRGGRCPVTWQFRVNPQLQ